MKTAYTLLFVACLLSCTTEKASEVKSTEEPAGLQESPAKKPRNISKDPLLTKGDQQVEPETLAPYSGRVYKLYDDKPNVVKWEENYKDGKKHGLSTYYDENGNKDWEINYKDGKKHGLHTCYYENGNKMWETNYKDGKKHGLLTHYYENGNKRSETNWIDDLKSGLHQVWSPDGTLFHKDLFPNISGQAKYIELDENGAIRKEENYKGGKLHGPSTGYNENGNKDWETNYKDGELHGPSTVYSENGTKWWEQNYKDGKLHGLSTDALKNLETCYYEGTIKLNSAQWCE